MRIIHRMDLEKIWLPGRVIEKAVGKDSYSDSKEMTVGFARYSEESGPMEPHRHAEEVVYIVSTKLGRICFGEQREKLDTVVELKTGMLLHIPAREWHVFEFDSQGHVEIIFIYGRIDDIRAEDDE